MNKKVIDVSSYQGTIAWERVKTAGIVGAILKVMRKDLNPDKQFEKNWAGCIAAGMPVIGAYNYSYATTVEKAISDAKRVLEILNGRKVKVWMDVEDNCLKNKGHLLIEIILAYQNVIESAGYEFGVYTGRSFYNSFIRLYASELNCDFWIARYPLSKDMEVEENPAASKKPEILHTMEGWQYTSHCMVPGISDRGKESDGVDRADMSIWYGNVKEEGYPDEGRYREKVVEKIKSWIGKNEYDGTHREIIDIYNSHKPLARGYKLKYTDPWCAGTVSAVAIALGYTDIIPTECSCEQMIKLFKRMGCWIENDNYIPKPADIIFYDWQDDGAGDNTGWSDHVGYVTQVIGNKMTVTEGNYGNAVQDRELQIGGKYIRGYGVPNYGNGPMPEEQVSNESDEKKSIEEIALDVKAGKYGNNPERRQKLLEEGYDPAAVQAIVNQMIREEKYYLRYTGTSTKIDVVFRKIGVPEKYTGNPSKRRPVAVANGLSSYYKGSYKDNMQLISLAKQGKLRKC